MLPYQRNNMQPINTKQAAAEAAVAYIKSGMAIGLGTGSTAAFAIQKLGERVKEEGLQVRAIATSLRSEEMAKELNIPIIGFDDFDMLDITIDGADEVDENLDLIKGGGGALLREKVVSMQTKINIIVIDETKLVKHLGKFPLPVEVVPFALTVVDRKLQQLGCQTVLRKKNNEVYITDNQNYILDCHFDEIDDTDSLHQTINAITGVVDNGLFIQRASMVIAAYKDGRIATFKKDEKQSWHSF